MDTSTASTRPAAGALLLFQTASVSGETRVGVGRVGVVLVSRDSYWVSVTGAATSIIFVATELHHHWPVNSEYV